MRIHQSDLSSWSWCAQRHFLAMQIPQQQTSATAFGTVIHSAVHVMERLVSQGVPIEEAREQALNEFITYWNPMHIEGLTEPVPADGWLRGQTYGGLRQRGIETIQRYAQMLHDDDTELLALEYEFEVLIPGTKDERTGEPHILAGTIDRLSVANYKRVKTLQVQDYKTGFRPKFLRYNQQGTAYMMASTQRSFWDGFPQPQAYFEAFVDAPRRFVWVDLKDFSMVDGGYREPIDYARFAVAVTEYARSVAAGIFPLNISGEKCEPCPHRRATEHNRGLVCGGVGLPENGYDPSLIGA